MQRHSLGWFGRSAQALRRTGARLRYDSETALSLCQGRFKSEQRCPGVYQGAAAVLDSAGIDPNTLLNVTVGDSEGISGDEVGVDGGSSFRSYFDVFGEPEAGGAYTGWADEAHGTPYHHMRHSIILCCVSAWGCWI